MPHTHFLSKKDIIIPKRNPKSKKGDNGRVLIIGGSRDYTGAVALAGISALRAGCDWVTIACPEKVAWAINSLSADLVTKKLPGEYISLRHYKLLLGMITHYDTVLIGNGTGLRKETQLLIKKIITIPNLKVIDADAIKTVNMIELRNSIITPHIKELEIFMRNSGIAESNINKINNEKSPLKISRLLSLLLRDFLCNNNVILLKGHIDIILSEQRILFNKTGNPGMAKAGTGDVLAGLCLGFLAQNHDLLQSAINSAYINCMIGDLLFKKKKGYSFIASDMITDIENVTKRLQLSKLN